MSPPLLDVGGAGGANASLMASSTTVDYSSHEGSGLKERNYLGLSDCSSVDSSGGSSASVERTENFNIKATELRLGLPGPQSPERGSELKALSLGNLDEKPLFPLLPLKDAVCSSLKTIASGNKRGFSDAMDRFSGNKGSGFTEGNWMFNAASPDSKTPQSIVQGNFAGSSEMNLMLSNRPSGLQPPVLKDITSKASTEKSHGVQGSSHKKSSASNLNAPAAKAQVVGWPPVRSFRKNTLASTSKAIEEVDGKPGSGGLFIKVSMDGAPYLRKVDLKTYTTYQELSSALEKLFSCFTIGQHGSEGAGGKEILSESKLKDLLHGSDYVLTYEDKDGDWMLVGDVPWEMFVDTCKRLKIMKGSDAIGLAPRAVEKSKNRH